MDPTVERRSSEHLSDIDIAKILALDKVSTSQRTITSLVNCSRHVVWTATKSYVFETFQGRNPRLEYKRKTTNHEDRYIKRVLKQNNSVLLRDITNIIQNDGLVISERTLRCRRSEVRLRSYIAAEKPGLHIENVAK